MDGRFISYLRVSTQKQGQSGLGLEAQRDAVARFLNGGRWELLQEYVEVESGKNDDRPKLAQAIERCRLTGAVLLVAKLDRLSRDAAFLLTLNKSGIEIRACDMPEANTMMFGIMALVAQHEREAISKRTKDALAAAKARGTNSKGEPLRMGGFRGYVPDPNQAAEAHKRAADTFAHRVGPMIREMRDAGTSLPQIAAKLTADGIRTPRGGQWTPTAVSNVLKRLERAYV